MKSDMTECCEHALYRKTFRGPAELTVALPAEVAASAVRAHRPKACVFAAEPAHGDRQFRVIDMATGEQISGFFMTVGEAWRDAARSGAS